MNKAFLKGYVGQRPEIRFLNGSMARLRFRMATTDAFLDKNGIEKKETEWHNVVMWNDLAKKAEKMIDKGSYVKLEGSIKTRNWVDTKGLPKHLTEIVATSFELLQKNVASSEPLKAEIKNSKPTLSLDDKGLPY